MFEILLKTLLSQMKLVCYVGKTVSTLFCCFSKIKIHLIMHIFVVNYRVCCYSKNNA